MSGTKGRSGGARMGSGPIRRRFTLSTPAAILLRTLTQSTTGNKDVSAAEMTAVLEDAIRQATDARLAQIGDEDA